MSFCLRRLGGYAIWFTGNRLRHRSGLQIDTERRQWVWRPLLRRRTGVNTVLGPQGILMISCNLNSSDPIIKTYLGRKSQEKTQKQSAKNSKWNSYFKEKKEYPSWMRLWDRTKEGWQYSSYKFLMYGKILWIKDACFKKCLYVLLSVNVEFINLYYILLYILYIWVK